MNSGKITLSLFFFFASVTAFSQKVYFIYIQTENKQPFFVKMQEKIYNSTPAGYLVLSKLKDTTHNFSIGLPGDKNPPQNFAVTMAKKDHGFLYKNFGDKGWGLFNLQTLEVKMSSNAAAQKNESDMAGVKDVSPFTEGLSKASDDPSLKIQPERTKANTNSDEKAAVIAIKNPEPTTTTIANNTKPAEEVVAANQPAAEPVKKKEEPSKAIVKEPTVKIEPLPQETAPKITEPVISNAKTDEPVKTIGATKNEEVTTTEEKNSPVVKVLQENPSMPVDVSGEIYKPSVVKKKSESSTTEGFGLTFIDTNPDGSSDTIKLLIPNPKTPQSVVATKENAPEPDKKINCMLVASDDDFLQLRKKMAAADGNDAMINEAKNQFYKTCFTTQHIKNLSTLFLTDDGKYKFFDAAYEYTRDIANFSSLETELKDEYYIKRFKALLRN